MRVLIRIMIIGYKVIKQLYILILVYSTTYTGLYALTIISCALYYVYTDAHIDYIPVSMCIGYNGSDCTAIF